MKIKKLGRWCLVYQQSIPEISLSRPRSGWGIKRLNPHSITFYLGKYEVDVIHRSVRS